VIGTLPGRKKKVGEIGFEVLFSQEDILSLIASGNDMVEGAGKMGPGFSSHG